MLVFLLFASYSGAQDFDSYFSINKDLSYYVSYDSKKYLSGNWGGFRGKLNELGITPIARYYTTVLGNPVGGEKKGIQYAGLLNAYLIFDLERLINIKRTRFIVSGSWASGRSLSNEDIGNFFTVSEVFSGRTVRLYQLLIESEIVEGVFRGAIGRMAVGDEFATSPIFYNYVNTAIDGNPISIPINDEGFLIIPDSGWGARIHLIPAEEFYIKAGVYNSNTALSRNDNNGFDFSFKNGVILISELGYLRNKKKTSKGLPGRYTFGAFYDTRKFSELDDEYQREKGNYSLYWIVEQMIFRETKLDDQGLTPWASVTLSPDESVNTFPFFIMGGLLYKGAFTNRNDDKAAFGFAYGAISDKLEDKDYELMFELTYIIQATPWLRIQPDVQWIINPGGSPDIPNALVLGAQLAVDL